MTVTLNNHSYDAVVASNTWTATVLASDLAHAALPDGSYTVTASVSDAAGNPATPATKTLKVDETAPSIAINTIAGDNVLNSSEAQSNLAISGATSGVEDGQHVTVTLNNHSYDAVVASNTWTATVLASDLAHAALPDGSYTVTASVSDAAGNPATPATKTLKVDETAPSIAINTIAGDNVLNSSEAQSNLAISGATSGVEDGQHVTVTLNNHSYDAVVTSNTWTATVLASDLAHAALPDGSYTVTASVSDAAGNPATPATKTLKVDETAPSIAINTIAGDNVLNSSEAQSNLAISGATSGVEDGQHVTVTLNNHSYDAVVASNTWTATVLASDLAHAALPDGSYTVTASVSDAAGNPATPATKTLKVDETAPSIAINTIAGDNVLNSSEAQAGFLISGSETGADGQTVTVKIIDSSGTDNQDLHDHCGKRELVCTGEFG